MPVQGRALFVALLFASLLPAVAVAQTSRCPGIHVKILNIRNRNGTVVARSSTPQRASLAIFCFRHRTLW